ncbi:2829_t:CDS:2, partial [Entrophospora sp. SA101]
KSYEIPQNLIERLFRKKFPPYYLASLECIVDRKCLPTGYHTTCIPSSGICDHCRQALSNSTNKVIILICGHGYHNRCYNLLGKTCKWCKEYYEKGIDEIEDVDENLEIDDCDEEDDVIIDPNNLNEISYEIQVAIDNVKDW